MAHKTVIHEDLLKAVYGQARTMVSLLPLLPEWNVVCMRSQTQLTKAQVLREGHSRQQLIVSTEHWIN